MSFTISNSVVSFDNIQSSNDGDVCISYITNELIKNVSAPICIDIGADMCWWALFCKYINQNTFLYVFEPNPHTFKLIKDYESETMHLFNSGVSDTNGKCNMEFNGSNSSLRTNTGTLVDICTLDFIFNKTEQIDLIKIDTEGHDLIIVNSIVKYFHRINSIVFEYTVFWYGKTKNECIQNSLETLILLSSAYKYIYVVSRNGEPRLITIEINDYIPVIILLYENNIQVDILASNTRISTIRTLSVSDLFNNIDNSLFQV